jgi:outer membrane protein assembly factor BamB
MPASGALVRLIAILIVAAALPCRAGEVISGRWEGSAQIPDGELNLIVDLSQQNGAWVGSVIIPGLGVKGAPLTDIKVQPPDVSFAVKGALGIQLKLVFKVEKSKQNGGWVLTGDRKFNGPFLFHSNWREAPLVATDQQIRLGGIYSSPLVVNGVVYFGSADGFLYALE